jgi:hypothetical protein
LDGRLAKRSIAARLRASLVPDPVFGMMAPPVAFCVDVLSDICLKKRYLLPAAGGARVVRRRGLETVAARKSGEFGGSGRIRELFHIL